MMNKTNITILEISDKGTQVKVKGQGQDGTHNYSVFKTKQDQSPTQAYSLLQTKGVGQQICFGWEEYRGEYQGKPYVSRSVKMAQEAGNSDYVPNVAQPARTQPRPLQSQPDDDKARGMVRNTVAKAFIGQGAKFEPSTVNEMNKWVGWIMTGELFNKEPMNVPSEQEYKPSGDWQEDDIRVEKIPFN